MSDLINTEAQDILNFWLFECSFQERFQKSEAFDSQIKDRFGHLVEQALQGDLDSWAEDWDQRLSLIILLDQFTRNIYRDTPEAFSGDHKVSQLSIRSTKDGHLENETDRTKIQFTLMPMMHSEDIEVQDASLPLFEKYSNEETLKYAIAHRTIIARFGRFPHRNVILGRESTKEEIEFLKGPNSSF